MVIIISFPFKNSELRRIFNKKMPLDDMNNSIIDFDIKQLYTKIDICILMFISRKMHIYFDK